MKWKTISKIAQDSGLSEESLRSLKKKGYLREKLHWKKAPNGRIFINTIEFEKWIEGSSNG